MDGDYPRTDHHPVVLLAVEVPPALHLSIVFACNETKKIIKKY
jgi:hypothetical protein